jgi:hypothetical protein
VLNDSHFFAEVFTEIIIPAGVIGVIAGGFVMKMAFGSTRQLAGYNFEQVFGTSLDAFKKDFFTNWRIKDLSLPMTQEFMMPVRYSSSPHQKCSHNCAYKSKWSLTGNKHIPAVLLYFADVWQHHRCPVVARV